MGLRIIALNRADAATLSVVAGTLASYPVNFLKTALRSEFVRTVGDGPAIELRAVWGSSQSIGAVALCQHNLTTAATWRVRVFSDAVFGSAVYDSGTVTAYDSTEMGLFDTVSDASFIGYKNSVKWFTPVNGQSMSIVFNDSANPDDFIQAARLFAGPYTEIVRGFDWGHPLDPVSPTTQSSTLGGDRLSQYNGPVRRQLKLAFNNVLSPTDRNFLYDLARVKELSGDIFISAYPGAAGKKERDYQMWCKIIAKQGFAQPLLNWYGTEMEFGEC